MTAPRLEIDLEKIAHNARVLVKKLAQRGISVTGVTKATLGCPEIAKLWIQAGVSGLGDSRIENINTLRHAKVDTPMSLIRTPMLSRVDEVVAISDQSLNTELEVIRALSAAAQKANRIHEIILMVELGDLREGIMPCDLEPIIRDVLHLPNILFKGIGTNLACRSGVSPDEENMAELSALADSIDATFGPIVRIVSGGNSANLKWALSGAKIGRINHLRLGEALLLGREPLFREPIDDLHTDAFTLIAEVIESKTKPAKPWGKIAQSAFGEVALVDSNQGLVAQKILALGRQDIDPEGLKPSPGIEILSASSDHLVVNSNQYPGPINVGTELPFQLNYSALLRAMTSPFIRKTTCSA